MTKPPSWPETPYPYPPERPMPERRDPVVVPIVYESGDPLQQLYDRRTVLLGGPLDAATATRIAAQLMSLDADRPVELLVNSPGGPVAEVFAVLDVIALMRGPVNTTCIGRACGTAAAVLAVRHRAASGRTQRHRLAAVRRGVARRRDGRRGRPPERAAPRRADPAGRHARRGHRRGGRPDRARARRRDLLDGGGGARAAPHRRGGHHGPLRFRCSGARRRRLRRHRRRRHHRPHHRRRRHPRPHRRRSAPRRPRPGRPHRRRSGARRQGGTASSSSRPATATTVPSAAGAPWTIGGSTGSFGLFRVATQIEAAADDQGDRHPLVPPQAAQLVGGVDAQALDPEPADAVAEHVHRQQTTAGRPVAPVDPQQQAAQGEVPQRLVEERRVERRPGRVTRREVLLVDLQRPRQVGRPAVELLVEVVAPAPDRLRQRQRRSHGVEPGAERDAPLAWPT